MTFGWSVISSDARTINVFEANVVDGKREQRSPLIRKAIFFLNE